MPFNDKGEFVRSPAGAAQTRNTQSRSTVTPTTPVISRDDLLTIAKGLAALALLAGLIWFVLMFRVWIVIGLVLWAIRGVRGMLR